MSKHHRNRFVRWRLWLEPVCARLANTARRFWRVLCRWRRPVPVEVLIADHSRGRTLERELGVSLRRLERVLGDPLPGNLAVIVQHVIRTDRQLAGCYQIGQRPDGSRFALIRLALQVNGRRLSTDELLAVLAEQCIGLATQLSGGPSALVPIELESAQQQEAKRLNPLHPDPLAPRPNGSRSGDRVA